MVVLLRRVTFFVLCLTIFTIPWQKGIIIPGFGSINKLLGIILIIVATITVLIQKKIRKLPVFFYILYLFIFWNIASYFWSYSTTDTVEKSLLFIQLGVLAWAIYEFGNSEKKINLLFISYVYGCSVIAIHSFYLYLTSSYIVTDTRFFLEDYNPNQLGILWTLSLPISIYLILKCSKLFLLYIPLSVFLIFLTGSRTALIILVFVTISIIWMLFKYRIKYRKLSCITLIIIGWIIVAQIPQGQLERLSTVGNEITNGNLNGRTDIWEAGYIAFTNSPIFGTGAGTFQEASVEFSIYSRAFSAHNTYLSVLVENGLIGFLLFAGILVTLVYLSMTTEKKDISRWLCLTLIITWLIISIVGHAEAQKYTWIMFSLIVSLCYLTRIQNLKLNK